MSGPLYVGIDLGTTNSTAAAFDGSTLTVVRNAAGSTLTPSVVRLSPKGQLTIGEKARRFLDTDAENARGGFKRLMGTDTKLLFPAAKRELSPEELSAEVLKSLAHDVEAQLGVRPHKAVITVPALFELPQTRATSEAARLAGFEQVELLQEPVASALAAGFRSGSEGRWLVYDLGGGTFDVSLLEGKDGILRVVGHDGDNFLGGRDFDSAIVRWAVEMLAADGKALDPKNPAHQPVLRRLAALAEEAKIELGRSNEVTLAFAEPVVLNGEELELELSLTRAVLERLVEPLVERSCEVCLRLLGAHNVHREDLERVVLVGGPTAMPFVRARVAERVGPLAAEALDPMTLVAQGAALYAASSGLDARPLAMMPVDKDTGHRLVVKAPTISTDLMPFVVGKLADKDADGRPAFIRLDRTGEPAWQSERVAIDHEGSFAVMAELVARRESTFNIVAEDPSGHRVAVVPRSLNIIHNITINNPPISQSINITLTNNAVQVYFEKGAPLPAKRTFVHHTVDTVVPGDGVALRIPLVQGELEEAHLCRLIGALEVPAGDLDRVLPVNTAVEVTLELDRGGQLSARAFVPSVKKVFEQVAHLVVPEASVEALRAAVVQLLDRLASLRADAKRHGATWLLDRIDGLLREQQEAERALDAAMGGDQEQAQRARRLMLDLEAKVGELESEGRWPELEGRAFETASWAAAMVSEYGTAAEQKLLDDAIGGMNRARDARSVRDLERNRRVAYRLGNAAFFRDPEAWNHVFHNLAADAHQARDLRRAEQLVEKGRVLVEKRDTAGLKAVCDELSGLLPVSASQRARGYSSGLR